MRKDKPRPSLSSELGAELKAAPPRNAPLSYHELLQVITVQSSTPSRTVLASLPLAALSAGTGLTYTFTPGSVGHTAPHELHGSKNTGNEPATDFIFYLGKC